MFVYLQICKWLWLNQEGLWGHNQAPVWGVVTSLEVLSVQSVTSQRANFVERSVLAHTSWKLKETSENKARVKKRGGGGEGVRTGDVTQDHLHPFNTHLFAVYTQTSLICPCSGNISALQCHLKAAKWQCGSRRGSVASLCACSAVYCYWTPASWSTRWPAWLAAIWYPLLTELAPQQKPRNDSSS